MRISKLYLVACAAALCGGLAAARADDNPDQAAARAALEAKMRELNTEPVTNNTPAPVKPAQTRPVAPATPATQQPPAAVPEKKEQPAPVTTAAPAGTAQPPTNPPAATVSRPAQKTAHASTASNTNAGWFQAVPPPSGSRHVITESTPTTEPKEKTEPKPKEQNPEPSQPVRTAPPAPVQRPVYTEHRENPNPSYPGKRLGFKPIEAPALPITQAQQEELQALLEKYEANGITPEQYQTERARILHQQ